MATSFYPGIVMDFDDTAFEPNAGYIFDESSGTDQLQRDIEASYTSNGIDDRDASRSASLTWGDQLGMSSNEAQQSFQASESFNPHPQKGTIGHRNSGITQRFGQVTPITSQSRSPASISDETQQQQQQQIAQSNAKSERARNAANHRHSQTKQARELLRKGRKSSVGRGNDEEEDKPRGPEKQAYREKNRQAAAKCRRKKKDSTEILESTARSAVEENTRLKTMVRQLRDQYSDLRTKALAHDGSDSCGCTDIHQYNADQAQQAARGHAGNAPTMLQDMQAMQTFQAFQNMPLMQSPDMGSLNSPEMPTARADSYLAGMHPEVGLQQSQHTRRYSEQESLLLHPALQLGGEHFAFDPRLVDIQEDGSNDQFQ